MKQLTLVCAVIISLSGSGCALFSAVKSGNPNAIANAGGNAVLEAKKLKDDSAAYAKQSCDPIRKAEVSWDEERAMGGTVAVKMVSDNNGLVIDGNTEKVPATLAEQAKTPGKVKLPDSPKNDLTAYLSVVGRNLARYSSRPDLPWTFAVIENDTLNAYSMPGGYVILTSGLLKKMTNEAQLAGVLAHEIGHVVYKHSINRYKEAKADQCEVTKSMAYLIDKGAQGLPGDAKKLAGFAKYFDNFDLDKADGKFIVFFIEAITTLVFGAGNPEADEFQADKTALELVAFAGYDPTEYEGFLTKIGPEIKSAATHPKTADRVAKLKALREGEFAPFATGVAKPDIAKAIAPVTGAK